MHEYARANTQTHTHTHAHKHILSPLHITWHGHNNGLDKSTNRTHIFLRQTQQERQTDRQTFSPQCKVPWAKVHFLFILQQDKKKTPTG